MNINSLKISRIPVLICMVFICQSGFGQPQDQYNIDSAWALMPGESWDGSTSWVAADGKGNILVMVRSAPYFRLYTREGGFIRSWGDIPVMNNAHSVSFDNEGNVWATDAARHVVYKYSIQGDLLMTLGRADEAGDNSDTRLFNQANHVFVSNSGDIYVSDGYVNSRVIQFNARGDFVRIVGGEQGAGEGQLDLPHGVALDSRGRILVNDSGNQRVSVFGADGGFIESWPVPSRGGIVVMADDTVYVSDVNAGAINILKDGQLLDTIKVDVRPHGLGVDEDGTVYITDARARIVMKLSKTAN